jgi:hypothetical protein
MWIYFPHQSQNRTVPDGDPPAAADDPLSRLPVSTETLRRHGARELVPGEAPLLRGQPRPLSTIYRSDTLVFPPHLLPDAPTGPGPGPDTVADALRRVRLGLAELPPPPEHPGHDGEEPDTGGRPRSPRAVRLESVDDDGQTAVDAWRALQALRARGLAERPDNAAAPGPSRPGITLQHLLFGAAVGSRVLLGAPGATEGSGFEDDVDGAYAQLPVDVLIDPPAERIPGSRRPVVAVLDTGVAANHWLGVPAKTANLGTGSYVLVDTAIQQAVADTGQQVAADPLSECWDEPITSNPLVGELTPYTGHGTFIAGIFRQLVPDARVLAIRIMRPDGVTYVDELQRALVGIKERNERARAAGGDPAGFVDVVSLSLRYYPEDRAAVDGLAADIEALTDQGVLVVAAAGNEASARPCYPAALATENERVIAVGALNPNGSIALFSNEAPWVTAWASGGSVVSTFPEVQAARQATITVGERDIPRETIDVDSYYGGWAIWSGTSFAAPLVAAAVVKQMVTNHEKGQDNLDDVSRDSTVSRVTKAVGDVRDESSDRPDQRT